MKLSETIDTKRDSKITTFSISQYNQLSVSLQISPDEKLGVICKTRATLNAEIPSAAQSSLRAECWDCDTVGTVKR